MPIRSQGAYPYCGLYSMATFLDLWASTTRPADRQLPPVDPAFLAFVYNAEIGSGSCGTINLWLQNGILKYGLVPEGATFVSGGERWRLSQRWRDFHGGLIDQGAVQEVLRARYHHPGLTREFFPLEYLAAMQIDFRELKLLVTSLREPYRPIASDNPQPRYRDTTEEATSDRVTRELAAAGVDPEGTRVAPEDLFDSTLLQMYRGRPVMATVNVGLLSRHLQNYTLVTGPTLVPPGEGTYLSHAVVAVAHCNHYDTRHPLCRRFIELMKQANVKEVIVFQNSWGADAHGIGKGYFALSRAACERMLTHVRVYRDIAAKCADRLELAQMAAAPASDASVAAFSR